MREKVEKTVVQEEWKIICDDCGELIEQKMFLNYNTQCTLCNKDLCSKCNNTIFIDHGKNNFCKDCYNSDVIEKLQIVLKPLQNIQNATNNLFKEREKQFDIVRDFCLKHNIWKEYEDYS